MATRKSSSRRRSPTNFFLQSRSNMTADPRLVSEEHWAKKGEVSLFVARKRLRERSADQSRRLPVILVHGSSISALPTFDLTVPGDPDYSLMDWLAVRGWDVWAMDH